MTELLNVVGLRKSFRIDARSEVVAVNDVSLSIRSGETLGLVGESGSGKTTVGRCILRLIAPDAGRISFAGIDLSRLGERDLRRLRPRMQLVFQDPFGSLNPRFTVGRTLEEPLALDRSLARGERARRLLETMATVRLGRETLDKHPIDLTTSEQQRVALARTIITRPDLVVLDEPTSGLDAPLKAEMLDLLADLQREFSIAYLFISHDLTAVESISHRIAVMYLGHIVEDGEAQALVARQYHPYTRALLSAVLYPDPGRQLPPLTLEGEIPRAVNPRDECPLRSRCPFAAPICAERVPPLEPVADGRHAACFRWREVVGAATDSETRTTSPGR